MTILTVVDPKDDILRTKCETFVFDKDNGVKLADDMLETMRHHGWPVLTANEVGISSRVIIIEADPLIAIFNPMITKYIGDDVVLEESDLARRGLICKVKRPQGIRLRYQDELGNWNVNKYVGMTARFIMHGVDNLDGNLYYNKANSFHRSQALKKWKKRVKISEF